MRRHPPPAAQRAGPLRPPLPVIHLLTEGRLTEVEYFTNWGRELRAHVRVTIDDFHGTPARLVDRAVMLQTERKKAIQRGRDARFDATWCVFDQDDHPGVDAAIALARQHDIGIAHSNPCFELWLSLHGTSVTRNTDRGEIQRQAQSNRFTAAKRLHDDAWPRLMATWADAQSRANELDRRHKGNGSPANSNPSTTVGHLVASLLDMRKG